MSYDPDFLVVVDGTNVTQSVMDWNLSLPDNDSCTLSVTIENQNSEWAGLVKVNSQVSFLFGYVDNIQPMIMLDVLHVAPAFELGTKTIKFRGTDELHKLNSNSMKGCFKSGTDTAAVCKNIAKAYTSYTPDVNLTSPKFQKDFAPASPGWTPMQNIQYYSKMSRNPNGNPNSSWTPFLPGPSSVQDFKGTLPQGNGSAPIQNNARIDNRDPKCSSSDQCGANTIDQNRNANMNQNKKAGTVTAKLHLMGYPSLRPSQGVTVLNVDEYSGAWYATQVNHSWEKGGNYFTDVTLQSGSPDCSDKAPAPMVISCDLFNKSIYIGPRKTDAASQATFVYGSGDETISFHPVISTENKKKGASQSVGSKGKLADSVGNSANQQSPKYKSGS
jgi:phage protein D